MDDNLLSFLADIIEVVQSSYTKVLFRRIHVALSLGFRTLVASTALFVGENYKIQQGVPFPKPFRKQSLVVSCCGTGLKAYGTLYTQLAKVSRCQKDMAARGALESKLGRLLTSERFLVLEVAESIWRVPKQSNRNSFAEARVATMLLSPWNTAFGRLGFESLRAMLCVGDLTGLVRACQLPWQAQCTM